MYAMVEAPLRRKWPSTIGLHSQVALGGKTGTALRFGYIGGAAKKALIK